MSTWAVAWLAGIGGLVVGAAAATVVAMLRRSRLDAERALAGEQRRELSLRLETADAQREDAERQVVALTEQLRARHQQFDEQRALLDRAEQRLTDTFGAIGAKALHVNSEQFITLAREAFAQLMTEAKGTVDRKHQAFESLVKPIHEMLEKHQAAVGDLERKREVAYRGLEEQIKLIASSHERLNTETHRLVSALRRPEQRGRWGEMQLRNAVELAGMTAHCDFEVQPQTDDPSTRDRPDMIVHLPGGGVVVVDAKVAVDAYLDSLEPDADQAALLERHADQFEQHHRRLAAKRYWNQFERTPRLVVMFTPLESALVAALQVRPELHARAMRDHVLIATPTLLVALLSAVAYGWQQESVAENAREIARAGHELYDRISTFLSHLETVGANLERSTKAYNQAVGSLESRVMPGARKLKELHATTRKDIESPRPLEVEVRQIMAAPAESGVSEPK